MPGRILLHKSRVARLLRPLRNLAQRVSSAVTEPAEIVIETADPDEIATSLAVPLNLSGAKTGTRIAAAADLGAIGYLRPAELEKSLSRFGARTAGK